MRVSSVVYLLLPLLAAGCARRSAPVVEAPAPTIDVPTAQTALVVTDSPSPGSGALVDEDPPSPLPLPCPPPELRGVVLMIGDGMGPVHVEAARQYRRGRLAFDRMPHRGAVATASADNAITDSAAAATAMATGVRVNNGVIAVELPGTGAPLPTVLEAAQRCRRSVGLVTTAQISHATPAAFSAHVPERGMYLPIADQQLTQTRPNVLFGGGGPGLTPEDVVIRDYRIVLDADQLAAVDVSTAPEYLAGLFAVGHLPYVSQNVPGVPRLAAMTAKALDLLDRDPDGFFLMVEGGRIDHAAHDGHIEDTVLETVEFAASVGQVLDWAANRADIAVLVTADHETGGLAIVTPGDDARMPEVTWSTSMHTGVDVDYWAWGPGADALPARILNTDIARWASGLPALGAP